MKNATGNIFRSMRRKRECLTACYRFIIAIIQYDALVVLFLLYIWS